MGTLWAEAAEGSKSTIRKQSRSRERKARFMESSLFGGDMPSPPAVEGRETPASVAPGEFELSAIEQLRESFGDKLRA